MFLLKKKNLPWIWNPRINDKYMRLKVHNGYVTIVSNKIGAWIECSELKNNYTTPIDILRRNGNWYVRCQTSKKKMKKFPLYFSIGLK